LLRYAPSTDEINKVRAGTSSASAWFAPNDEMLPESDEEEMASTPEELTIGAVVWKVAVLRPKAAAPSAAAVGLPPNGDDAATRTNNFVSS
jgi:hypothetical protein